MYWKKEEKIRQKEGKYRREQMINKCAKKWRDKIAIK